MVNYKAVNFRGPFPKHDDFDYLLFSVKLKSFSPLAIIRKWGRLSTSYFSQLKTRF